MRHHKVHRKQLIELLSNLKKYGEAYNEIFLDKKKLEKTNNFFIVDMLIMWQTVKKKQDSSDDMQKLPFAIHDKKDDLKS